MPLAAEGRTVLVSSHLMSEMEHTADHLLVIGRGSAPTAELRHGRVHRPRLLGQAVLVRTRGSPTRSREPVATAGASVSPGQDEGRLRCRGLAEALASELRLRPRQHPPGLYHLAGRPCVALVAVAFIGLDR